MSSELNKWIQNRLTSHGFPVGSIDGLIGKTTIAGIKAFQRKNKIPVTGQPDIKTVELLKKSSTSNYSYESKRNEFYKSQDYNKISSVFPYQKDVPFFYGKVGTNQTSITPPWRMKLSWDKRRYIQRMTLHELVADSALRAMQRVQCKYGICGIRKLGLDMFGGSLNIRKMRGSNKFSMHSWGIAIDFDPERNQLRWNKPKARLSLDDVIPFWECWEDEGWISLGRERNFDWMHVQAALI